MTISKYSRILAFFLAVFYAASTAVYADTLSGKIVSIRALQSGQSEIVLSKDKKNETLLVNSKTEVESMIPADKLKAGAMIYLPPQGGAGGRKGMKSPFRGIPKNMRKSMGLPNMPETPDVPGQPSETKDLPKVPKVPKAPKVSQKKGKKEAAAPEQESTLPQGRKPQALPVGEPTAEEKNLYGRATSDQPLLKSTGGPSGSEKMTAKKVLSVKAVKDGVRVELQGPDGKVQQITLPAKRNIAQVFSSEGLRKNMQVTAETVKADEVKIAQKITVVP